MSNDSAKIVFENAMTFFGEETSVDFEPGDRPRLPETYLAQNFPNPFNATTSIKFYLESASTIKLSVYNILGQEITILAEELLPSGEHQVTWNAVESPSGVYFIRLSDGSRQFTRRTVLLK
jgi:hypothetical protein